MEMFVTAGLFAVMGLLGLLWHIEDVSERKKETRRAGSREPAKNRHDTHRRTEEPRRHQQPGTHRPRNTPAEDKGNAGETRVSNRLIQRYPDWLLIDNALVPDTNDTTQIDHILVSPVYLFIIETKNLSGWLFGSLEEQNWTQSFPAESGGTKKPSPYNPMRQNKNHAKCIADLEIVPRYRIRPVVVLAGDAKLKTKDKFPSHEEYEKTAKENAEQQMRGVLTTSLDDLCNYIDYAIENSSIPLLTSGEMQNVYEKLKDNIIPPSPSIQHRHNKHVESIKSVNQESQQKRTENR